MKNCNFNQVVRSFLLLAILLFTTAGFKVQAQVTTNGGSGLAATYPTLNDAITALNGAIISSPVVITLTGNETAPAGGYSITAEGTAVNSIIIEGVTSTITANNALVAGSLTDGIFKLIGADYITLRNFTMQENAANTTTAAATNNMTEWGVALLYTSTTNGAQNNTIQGNTISLNRTYQNTFGIYSNSTHSAAAPTTSATATGVTGGNHNLKIYSNTISNVNLGITIVGPTAATDHNQTLEIGGSALTANTITNYGTTGTFSGYANVSGTVNGILVRNTVNFTISNNTITSSTGGTTAGTLRGIFVPAFSNAPSGTIVNNVNNNSVSVQSAVAAGTLQGIVVEATTGNATTSLNINNNNFLNSTHTLAATGAITFINAVSPVLTLNVTNNTFTNLTVNTTGNVTFIGHSYTMPANATKTISNNSIVTAFAKTGAGGTVTFMTTGASSPNTASGIYTNNTITNITLTGATAFNAINDTDGNSSAPNKVFTGNTIGSITSGASAITGINCTYWGGSASSISGNSILNLNGQSAITGISLGSAFGNATNSVISANNIAGLFSTGTGGSVTGITCSNTSTGILISGNNIGTLASTGASAVNALSVTGANSTTVSGNTICSLSGSNPLSTVNGVIVSFGTLVTVSNNAISGLDAPIANAANPVNGINVTGGTTVNVYYNTVRLTGTSAGALFGSSALSVSTTPTVAVRNNIFVNSGTPIGTGLCVAYRRSTTTLTTFDNASNNNDLVGSTIFTDGTNSPTTLVAYQTLVAPREVASLNITPTFLSTTCGNSNFLRLDPAVFTALESGGSNIAGITTDIDGQTRAGNGGYVGTGSAPDIGADEVESSLPLCAGAEAGAVSPATRNLCTSSPTTTMTATGVTIGSGITFQWKVSATPGGPYSSVLGGTGANTSSYTTPSLPAGTYYFVMEATCSVGPVTDLTNEVTVVVNTNPTIAVTPSSATYCSPLGSAVNLVASGGSTYVWSPAAGLSATTGASVNATPSSNATYTVTGTDANGCTGTGTTTITVGQSVTPVNVTATPSSVCSGANSQLVASASVDDNYTVSSIPFAGVATPGTGVTTLTNAGVASTVLSSGTLDDGGWTGLALPFAVDFYGASYSAFSVSTNGFMVLGAGAPNTYTGYGNAFPNSTVMGRPSIGGTYSDLDFRTIGTINYFTVGSAPNRQFVINWSGGNFYNAVGAITTQVIIYETTNVIEVHTTNSTGTNNAVQGIQNASGTKATVATGRNNTLWTVVSPDAFRFTPPTLTYSWTPGTFLSSTSISNPLATAVTATTTYTVTANYGACSSSAPVTITAGSALTSSASITPSNTACVGTAVTISATGIGGGAPYTYAWTGPNGYTSTSASNPIAAVALTDAGLYSVTVTDNCGATSTSSVTLTVNALPVVSATPLTSTYCAPGTGVTLTASGATTYAWSPASGLSATTGASVIATPSSNTTYTVVGTDGNGCTASATAVVNSSLAVTSVTATATPASSCDSASVLNAVATIATPSYCQPTYSSGTGFGDYISSVQLNTLNNSTLGAATPFYTLYPASGTTTTTLTAGNTYTITLAAGTYTSNDLAAWIDFNQNGTLNDATEKLGETNNLGAAPTTTTFTFTVPLTANNGVTRLRVRDMDYSGTNTMDPCAAQSSFGETEDYNITIVGGVDPYTVTWSPATFLSSTTGATVNAAGITSNTTYTATVSTPAGCTNTATSTITLLPSSVSTTTITACGTYTWTNGTTYSASGSYTQTLVNSVGCDSIATLNLTINQPTSSTVTVSACGSYTWAQNATTYTTSGSYPVVLAGANAAGCDSTITLNLTINQPTSSTVTVTACGSYTWAENSTTYTTSGSYPVVLAGANANGCDSTVTLNLTINQPTSSTVTATACGSYTWAENSTTYTTSGSYPVVLAGANANGCDSTVTLNLTINQPTSSTVTATACGSYTWAENGTTYTVSGSYPVVLAGANANGCDSTVTLNLTINSPATGTDVQTACGSFDWIDGNTYTSSNNTATFTIAAGAANGCDSIVTLNLTINSPATSTDVQAACDTYTWIDGNVYTTSNNTATFTIAGGAANGCDSIVTLNLTITSTPVATATDNGSATITASAGATYQWIDCGTGTAIAGENAQTFTATANGSYAVVVSNGSCDDTSACVVINYIGIKELTDASIEVAPNPTSGLVTITMSAPTAKVSVLDAQGKLLQVMTIENAGTVDLSTYDRGIYILNIETENGRSLERIIKN